ncbi:MAG: SLC13 family permease [Bacteroidota bacterium]
MPTAELSWEAWYTIAVIVAMLVALVREVLRPDVVMLAALGALLLAGVLTPEQAFAGFSNPAVLTVASLFIVAAGVSRTGAFDFLDGWIAPRGSGRLSTIGRVMGSSAGLSALLNNTPIVAMLIPRVQAVAERVGMSSSRLMIPLSYAAIVGGMTTLIGTSTNLLASGFLQQNGLPGFSLFEFAWIGVPATLLVTLYMVFAGHRLLPDHARGEGIRSDARQFIFEVRVASGSVLAGRSVVEAELRSLGQAYLAHIRRRNVILPATPVEVLREEDVLAFSGDPDLLDRLVARDGLERVMNGVERPREDDQLMQFEAVVSANSGLVGRTLKEVRFRENYQGVVLAIHRRDEQIGRGLGTLRLEAGDLLLIEALPGFDRRHNQSGGDFYLVAPRKTVDEPMSRRAPVSMALFVGMIVVAAAGVMPLVTAAFLAALMTVFFRCLRLSEARRSLDFSILLMMAAALGIGQAVQTSGLAAVTGHGIVGAGAVLGSIGLLVGLYVATLLLTEVITNAAAVILMLPIALSVAGETNVDAHGLAIAVTIAASASFLSPVGYQTNLMVMSVGGYRFSDYFRAGIGVSLIVMLVTIVAVSQIWM